jgi:hypothetical protein
MLLQTQVSGTLDALEICAWLLGVIVILIGVIWRSNESKASERHQDILNLIKDISNRQDGIEDKLRIQEYDIIALKTIVKLLQGKTITLHDDEKNHH